MSLRVCACFFLLISSVESIAQQALAGRMSGTEGLYSHEPGIWAGDAYNAALAFQKNTSVGFYGEKRFLSELSYYGVLLDFLLSKQPFQIAYSSEGIPSMHSYCIGIATGKQVSSRLKIGLNAGYSAISVRGYPGTGSIKAGSSLLFQLNEHIRIGIQLNYLTSFLYNEGFPLTIRTGLGYRFSEFCAIFFELTKEDGKSPLTDFGVYYAFHPKVYSRLGYCPALSLISFNIGYREQRFSAELGQAIHLQLGSTWGIGLNYVFKPDE